MDFSVGTGIYEVDSPPPSRAAERLLEFVHLRRKVIPARRLSAAALLRKGARRKDASLELLEFVQRLAAYLFLRGRVAQAHEIAGLVQLLHHRLREHGVSDQRMAANDGIRGQNGDARPKKREVGRRARRVSLDEHADVT